jgi:hypothetical protein
MHRRAWGEHSYLPLIVLTQMDDGLAEGPRTG